MSKEQDQTASVAGPDANPSGQLPAQHSAGQAAEHEAFGLLTDRFAYLDDLRASGQTNMFGAGEYLRLFMGCGKAEARTVLSQWMETFDPKQEPAERAHIALAKARGEP